MNTEQQYLAIRNDSRIQLYIYKALGEYARNYVIRRFSNAFPFYAIDSDGRRTHVGIYITRGMEVTSRGNVCKEQYSVTLISKLISCSSPCGDEYLDNLNSYAWVSAMESILAANGEDDWQLAWLKKCTAYFSR
jgi:hypothetical protein